MKNIATNIPKRKTRKADQKKSSVKLSKPTLEKIRRKQRLWQRYKETQNEDKYRDYCIARNQVKSSVRNENKIFEKSIAEGAKENPKSFWKYVKSKTKTKDKVINLEIPGTEQQNGELEVTTSDKQKADVLLTFFSTVFTQEPDGDLPEFARRLDTEMPVINITLDDVRQKLRKVNPTKSPGPDQIHPRIYAELYDVLCYPLHNIFIASLEQGIVPKDWKEAQVSAIYKKGNKKHACNYRPVSLTSIACKLMESLVRDKIMNHLVNNSLISAQQFGFITGRSAQLQLLKVLNDWTLALDTGESIDCIYLDFLKAFDTVPHRRLIHKLKGYGIPPQVTDWITDLLTNRSHFVNINGTVSAPASVLSGIPQGSVIGPLLFVIYINDLPEIITSTAYLFADDTKLYIKTDHSTAEKNVKKLKRAKIIAWKVFQETRSQRNHRHFKQLKRQLKNELRESKRHNEELQASLQEDLTTLQNWSDSWLLRFNPTKCKVLKIGKKEEGHIEYQMDGIYLENIKEEKDIGVIVDSDLKFEKHIAEKVTKANNIMGVIRRSFTYLDNSMFNKLFKALVRPHLEYATSVWNPYLHKHINTIENVQRRATKRLPGMKNLQYHERLSALKLPCLLYRRLRGDLIEVFKITHEKYDKSVSAGILTMQNETTRKTRGHNLKLYKQYSRLNVRKNFFSLRITTFWNYLPTNVVNAPSVNTFESRLDKHYSQYDIITNYQKCQAFRKQAHLDRAGTNLTDLDQRR